MQGTAEGDPFTEPQLIEMIRMARGGLQALFELQKEVLGDALP